MSSEMMSKLGIICPCFKPLFKKKTGTYNLDTPPEGAKIDQQNNAIIVHGQNNRVDLDRQSEKVGERTTAHWDGQTNTVDIGGIHNATVDLDVQKGKGEIAAVHHNGTVNVDGQKVTADIGGISVDGQKVTADAGEIIQNGPVDSDRQTSDVVIDEVVDVPKVQSKLERLLEAAEVKETEEEEDRHIVGRERQKTGAEVKEELIVVESSAGLKAYSSVFGEPRSGHAGGYSSRTEEPRPDIETMDDITEVFKEISEGKTEIDAYQLQSILNNCFTQEFEFAGFSDDLCRSMVAMHDDDLSGRLSYHEFQELWTDLQTWKESYVEHDTDNNGYFDKSEFADILEQIGLSVNEDILHALTVRFSDREGHVRFDDFVACAVKLKIAITTFQDNAQGGDEAEFTTDQFIQLGMYT